MAATDALGSRPDMGVDPARLEAQRPEGIDRNAEALSAAQAAALVTSVGPHRSAEEQILAAGLELVGSCSHLSGWPGLMQHSELLQDFTHAEADILGQSMLLVRAQPGQALMKEDEASDWMLLLLRGTVDVGKRKIGAGGEPGRSDITRLAVLREGATIGEMSMLDGEPRYASCWALSEVECAVLSRAAVGRLITAHSGVGAKLLVKITQLLAQRLRNVSSQLVKLLQKS